MYPFGLKHKGYNNVINGTDHKYGFTGKEEQDELGLGWIDIMARNYDPALGRWMNLDVLAQKYESHSPYAYVGNSPIFRVDLDGMDWYTDADGNYHFNPDLNEDNAEDILKDGQRYFKGSYHINIKDGVTSINYLNNDGTVTDKDGNKMDAGSTITVGDNNTSITAYDDRPSTYDYKNGEEISSNDGHNYILHDNKWLKVETPDEYSARIDKRSKTIRRPPLPRTTRETLQYDQLLVNTAGANGATGLGGATGIIGKAVKGFKYTPVGMAVGYFGGQIKAYEAMTKRMNEHDKTVDYHRNKKKN